jgi:hypothetical protein
LKVFAILADCGIKGESAHHSLLTKYCLLQSAYYQLPLATYFPT